MPQSQRDGQVGWFDVRGVRVGDGLTVSWRDVSDRHTAAAVIAESEQRYRLLAENVQDVVMHIVDGTVRWVSPSLVQVLGWKPADWIGKRSLDYVHPDDVPMLVPWSAARRTGLGALPQPGARQCPAPTTGPRPGGVYHDAAGEPDGVINVLPARRRRGGGGGRPGERAQHDDSPGCSR
jgi:PAS domain-containing protein